MKFAYLLPTQFNQTFTYDAPIDFKLYKQRKRWVFDDNRTGLIAEAFVMGMDKIIDQLKAMNGIEHDNITFMMQDGVMCEQTENVVVVTYMEKRSHPLLGDSHWYRIVTDGIKGVMDDDGVQRAWLCPNIHRYYQVAPKTLCFWIVES